MSMKNINWMLGGDIIQVIFSKFHICNLPNCRIVCKAWNELVLDYAKFHHDVPNALLFNVVNDANRYSSLYFTHNLDSNSSCSVAATLRVGADWKDVTILQSCNGLLHISITYTPTTSLQPKIWAVWNPMTNEFFQPPILREDKSSYNFGFGFNPKTEHYKLFRALREDSITTIQVLSFNGFNGNTELQWRRAFGGHPPFEIPNRGTYLDGVIYFISKNKTTETKFVLYGLDVELETFEPLLILDGQPFSFDSPPYIRPLNDTVCVILPLHLTWKLVWVMKSKYLWTHEFIIDLPNPLNFSIVGASEDQAKLYFTSLFDLVCVDTFEDKVQEDIGKMTKMKTLFPSNQRRFINCISHIRSFNFGSLPMILAGND